MRCRAQRRQARRALAADRRPHRRADRPAPRALLRTGRTGATSFASPTSPISSSLDVTDGIDELDYSGPVVRRTPYRAGVVKVAGSLDGPSERDRIGLRGRGHRASADRCPDPDPLRSGHRSARADRAAQAEFGVDPSHVDPEPRRQGRRSRLPPRDPGDRSVRRVRPVVPLERRAEPDREIDRLDGRGRVRRPDRPRHGRRTARLPTACSAARRDSPGCSMGSPRSSRRVASTRTCAVGCSSTIQPGHSRSQRSMDESRTTPHQRRRVACPAVLVRLRDRCRRARRLRAGRSHGDAGRRRGSGPA